MSIKERTYELEFCDKDWGSIGTLESQEPNEYTITMHDVDKAIVVVVEIELDVYDHMHDALSSQLRTFLESEFSDSNSKVVMVVIPKGVMDVSFAKLREIEPKLKTPKKRKVVLRGKKKQRKGERL